MLTKLGADKLGQTDQTAQKVTESNT